MKVSYNDQIVVEAYKHGQGLQSEVKSGFAYVKQKQDLVGLEVLVEARLSDGSYVPKGSIAYISEENLTTKMWAKFPKTCKEEFGDRQVLVVQLKDVVFFSDGSKS